MTDKEAILGFMMGERIKSELIAVNTLIELLQNLPGTDKKGCERALSFFLGYLTNEIAVAERITPQEEWNALMRSLDQALVKVDSGIPSEAVRDITVAITKAVTVSQRTMSYLQGKGLL